MYFSCVLSYLFHENDILFGDLLSLYFESCNIRNYSEKRRNDSHNTPIIPSSSKMSHMHSQTHRYTHDRVNIFIWDTHRMPRSLALLSWRSMMLCRISSTSWRSSLSSIREMEQRGSRNAAGKPALIVLHLKPDVTFTHIHKTWNQVIHVWRKKQNGAVRTGAF